MRWSMLLSIVILCALGGVARAQAPASVSLRVATLAPAGSTWGKLFKAWQRGVVERSHGAIDLQVFYGTQQGDEVAIVGKMRTRQLDGAALSAVGLGQIQRDVLLFEMPGLFRDWAHLDAARAALRPELDASFERRGFKIVDWGDIGISHLMSKGLEVRVPSDLRRARCFYLPGDPMGAAFFQAAGGILAQQLSLPEVLPGLQAGTVNVLAAPSLAAEQLQWASILDHVDVAASNVAIGALVVSAAKVRTMPADLAAVLLASGTRAGSAASDLVRREDAAAFVRIRQRMTPYEPSAAEQEEWRAVLVEMGRRTRGAVFEPAFYDKVVKLAGVTP